MIGVYFMAEQSRYQKIVVPIDGSGWSEGAIPHAVDIARISNGEIILLHIFIPPLHEYQDTLALAGESEQIARIRDNIKQYLMGLRGQLRGEGVNCRVQLIEAVGIAGQICDYVNEQEADLVVMSTHGRTGLGRFVFGSVAHKVVQGVDIPVMLIRPDKGE
jgi:nucleotide-binding universal stress UspA family protein